MCLRCHLFHSRAPVSRDGQGSGPVQCEASRLIRCMSPLWLSYQVKASAKEEGSALASSDIPHVPSAGVTILRGEAGCMSGFVPYFPPQTCGMYVPPSESFSSGRSYP